MRSRISIALPFALLAGAAYAQTPDLTLFDTDRDGSISPAEAAASPELSAHFRDFDQNGNGALEPAEFSRFEAGVAPPTTQRSPNGMHFSTTLPGATNGQPGGVQPGVNSSGTAPAGTPPPAQQPPPPR